MDKTKKTEPQANADANTQANTRANISTPEQQADVVIDCSSSEIPVVLETPIVRGEQIIKVVYIRKAKSGEMRNCALADIINMDTATMERLLPRISRPVIHKHEFSQMSMRDSLQIGGAIISFFGDKKQWGEIRQERIGEIQNLRTSGATQ